MVTIVKSTKSAAKSVDPRLEKARAEFKAKKAKAAKPEPVKTEASPEVVTEVLDAETALEKFKRKLLELREEFMNSPEVCGAKRNILAVVCELLTYGAVFYGGWSLTMYAVIAATLFTGSAFLTFMVTFLGLIMTFMAAAFAARSVGSFVRNFDTSVFGAMKNRITGIFARDELVVAGAA